MSISERKKKILAAVVDEYIRTAEPVGSKAIAAKAGLGCSSATIRNELAELVNMGYLEQPHTSAGRVPTPMGYRMYVNELMEKQKLSLEETEEINRRLNQRLQELDDTISDVSRLASQLTNYPALALTTQAAVTIKRFDIIYVDANTFIIVVMPAPVLPLQFRLYRDHRGPDNAAADKLHRAGRRRHHGPDLGDSRLCHLGAQRGQDTRLLYQR